MANYSSDPRNAVPGNAVTPQNGPGGPVPSTPSAANAISQSADRGNGRQLNTGTILSSGRYKVENLVAAGGMGAVYRAIDTRFNKPCAVKEMLDTFRNEAERAQAVEWFSREATLLLELNHPCIPRVRDFFAESGKHYLVMDFIDGNTLAQMMDIEGTVVGVNGAHGVTEARARSWARQVCSVLNYLHSQSPPIIFRDLKPSNIMVTNRDEVKLIDFGIARTFQSKQQATVIMTLGYAPPEQLQGMPEPRSDIFALGSTIHKLLTHHDPLNNKDPLTNRPNMFAFPPVRTLRPDISPAFDHIIQKALAPDLEQRWPSASEMERALINLPPITATPPLTQTVISGQGGNQGPISEQNRQSLPYKDMKVQSGPPASLGTTGPAGSHLNAALAYLNSNPVRLDAAYESVKFAFALESNNPLVHRLFGQIFARRIPAQVDSAIQAYNRSLQLNPNDAETHKLVGDIWLYLRPNLNVAVQAYTQSLQLNPNDFETHERLALCYERTNRPDPALREYQEAVRLAASQTEAVRHRLFLAVGQQATRLYQWPVAEHAFVQALIINSADHQTRFALCQAYEQQNKLEEAFLQCGYVIGGPYGPTNPAVSQMYYRLKSRLGR